MTAGAAVMESGSQAGYLLAARVISISAIIMLAGTMMSRWEKGANQATLLKINSRIFIPCLVFASMTRSPLSFSEAVLMATAAALFSLACLPLAKLLSNDSESDRSGYVPMLFSSTSTMLLPLSYLLFGSQGIAKATFFHLTSLFMLYTWGMKSSRQPVMLASFFKTPTLHAALLAILLKPVGIELPQLLQEFIWLVEKGILMMAAGAIPLLLINHGYALSCLRKSGASLWSGLALARGILLPAVAAVFIIVIRQTGLAPTEKGYDLIQYLDLRTSEAILLLAAAMPCTISLFRSPQGTPSSQRITSLILSSSLLSLIFITIIVCMINRYIFSS